MAVSFQHGSGGEAAEFARRVEHWRPFVVRHALAMYVRDMVYPLMRLASDPARYYPDLEAARSEWFEWHRREFPSLSESARLSAWADATGVNPYMGGAGAG